MSSDEVIKRSIWFVAEMLEDRGEDVTSFREKASALQPNDYQKAKVSETPLMLFTEDTIVIYALFDKVGQQLGITNKGDRKLFSITKDSTEEAPKLKLLEGEVDLGNQVKIRIGSKKKNIILIVPDEFSNTSNMNTLKAEIAAIDKRIHKLSGGYVQVFNLKSTLYNPSRHELVPRHEKLSDEEAAKVREIYMIKNPLVQMPLIRADDVMARWIGLRHGDMVRITRINPNSGTSYYYRVCN